MMSKFKLTIQEYGKEVITCSDSDRDRFIRESIKKVTDHLQLYSKQERDDIKNIQIHLATYE